MRPAAAYPASDEPDRVAHVLRKAGGKVFDGHLDVRDSKVITAFIATAEKTCGPFDILVNAAGTTAEQPMCGHSDEIRDKIIDTNLDSSFRMTRALVPGMINSKWGRVINIGSTAATVG